MKEYAERGCYIRSGAGKLYILGFAGHILCQLLNFTLDC